MTLKWSLSGFQEPRRPRVNVHGKAIYCGLKLHETGILFPQHHLFATKRRQQDE